jgi:hypothetical protein
MLAKIRPAGATNTPLALTDNCIRGAIMAKWQANKFHDDFKHCVQCGEKFYRNYGQNGVNWIKRLNCSITCSNKAKVKTRPPVDMAGSKYGRWLVVSHYGRGDKAQHLWNCICDCGTERLCEGSALKSGNTKSCGCAQREAAAIVCEAKKTHGVSKDAPEYYVWASMKQRCTNPNVRNWLDYGGRGISVCDRWLQSFENFYADMGSRPSDAHSIDRIDNDGNYEPSNCQWVLSKAQCSNRRNNIMVEYFGRQMTLKQATALSGVKYSTARMRIKKGWSAERALVCGNVSI